MVDHCIGPQVSLSAVGEESEQEPRLLRNTTILTEGVTVFRSYFSSGSKFVEYIARHLINEAWGLERKGLLKDTVCAGLHVAQKLYEEVCSVLRLSHYISHSKTYDPNFVSSTCTLELPAQFVDEDNDLNWYFDSGDEQVAQASVPAVALVTDTSAHLSTFGTTECPSGEDIAGMTTGELQWLMRGLQHCLPHEFEPMYTPISASGRNTGMAIPMRLAGEVIRHLMTTTDRGSLSATLQESLHVRCIPGLPTYRCITYPGSLVLTSSLRAYDRAARCSRHGSTKPDDGARTIAVFRRSAVVQASLGQIGTTCNEANAVLGNSQQARSIVTQRVQSAAQYISSLRSESGGCSGGVGRSYLHRVSEVLRSQQVELVICERGMATTTLVDHLACAGIAVLAVGSSRELWSAADLTGAALVEDMTCLCAEDVGEWPVELQYLYELPMTHKRPTTGRKAAVPRQTEWSLRPACWRSAGGGSGGTDGVAEVGEGSDDGDNTHCLVSLTRVDSGKAPGNVETPAVAVVSVVMGCQTEALAAAYEDRFLRCLHRLRWALEGEGVGEDQGSSVTVSGICSESVMPGAGVPELLCMLRLDEEIEKYQRRGDSSDGRWQETEVLHAFRRVLETYLLQILQNNGHSHPEAQEQVGRCTEHYRTRCVGADSILDVVRAMSTLEKQSLPVPLDLSTVYGTPGLSQGVLDVVQVKVAAVDAAVMIVKQMLYEGRA